MDVIKSHITIVCDQQSYAYVFFYTTLIPYGIKKEVDYLKKTANFALPVIGYRKLVFLMLVNGYHHQYNEQ